MDADVTVIGGGIHGCIFSVKFRLFFPHLKIIILDAEGIPLKLWNRRTASCSTQHLRSPASHTIDHDFRSLLHYAKHNGYTKNDFSQPYWRPSLSLFRTHSEHVLRRWNIHSLITKAQVTLLQKTHQGWQIHSDKGIISSRVVILSLGSPPLKRWHQKEFPPHIFDGPNNINRIKTPVAIIGAGMTGTQTALHLLQQSIQPVWLIDPKGIKVSSFDSNPCFIGPTCRKKFLDLKDYRLRLQLLQKQRYPGTIPQNLYDQLQQSPPSQIKMYPRKVSKILSGGTRLVLDDGKVLRPNQVLLATGFSQEIPQKSLIEKTAQKNNLPLTENGQPFSDPSLQWEKRLFLSGKLADLELGPAAPNIIGAHLAWRVMQPALKNIFSDR